MIAVLGGRADIQFVLRYLRPHLRGVLYGTGLTVVRSLLVFPMPFLTMYLIDVVLPSRQHTLLYLLAALGMGSLALKWFVDFQERLLWARINERVILNLSADIFRKLQSTKLIEIQRRGIGYVCSRLLDDSGYLRSLLADAALDMARETLVLLASVIAMLALNWRLALLSLLCLPGFVTTMGYFNRKLRGASKATMECEATLKAETLQSLQGMETYRLLTAEAIQDGRLRGQLENRFRAVLTRVRVVALSGGTNSAVASLGPLTVLVYGGLCVMSGEMTIGALMAFSSLLGNALGPSARLVASNNQIQHALPALSRIREIMALPQEESCQEPVLAARCVPTRGHLVVRDLTFRYDGVRPFGLTIPFLEVVPGEWVAIAGTNGSGKSTLNKLILRFLEPSGGSIELDGVDIRHMRVRDLRTLIGALLQEPVLFADTIEFNIRLGKSEATSEEVQAAARMAGADGFVSSLPHGYSTVLQEGGKNLSHGQRQRIALARLILRNPAVVILDEPTVNVDHESEEMIVRGLRQFCKGRTTLMVSHNPLLRAPTDRVVVMANGALLSDTVPAQSRDLPTTIAQTGA